MTENSNTKTFDGFHGDAGLRPAIAAFGGSSDVGFGIEGPVVRRSRYFRGRYASELASRTVIVQIADPSRLRPDIRIRVRDFDAERVAGQLASIGCVTNQSTPEEEKHAAAVRASFADPLRLALFCGHLSAPPVALSDFEDAVRAAVRLRSLADQAEADAQREPETAFLRRTADERARAANEADVRVGQSRERVLALITRG